MKRIVVFILLCLFLITPASAEKLVIPDGAVGIWCIPGIRVHMPVYTAEYGHEQEVIDEPESALLSQWYYATHIGDHYGSIDMNGDGEWRMDKISVGSKAWMLSHDENEKKTYECYMVAVVDVQPWGYSLCGEPLLPHSSLDILCSCCVGSDSTRNYVAAFRCVGRFG